MLFRKTIEKSCSYCQLGTKINENQAICIRRGIVSLGASCRFFTYDPFLRVPPKPAKVQKSRLSDEDFSID